MIQNKQKDESYISFAKRITDAYENRLINIDEWGEMILGENIYHAWRNTPSFRYEDISHTFCQSPSSA